jgi:hypothetical protein
MAYNTRMRIIISTDADYDEFEQALGNQLAHYTPARLARLVKVRSSVDKSDPRYAAALKRAFDL